MKPQRLKQSGHIGPGVESVLAGGGLPIVVDNGSTDDTLQMVRAESARLASSYW